MITFRTVQTRGGLGFIMDPGGGGQNPISGRPGLTPGVITRPSLEQAKASIDAAAAGATTACGDPRLTTDRQRQFCAESFQAGLIGDELIINAIAKDTCASAVDQGLIPVEAHTTCVDCARASIAGRFDAGQIPACVAAGGPGTVGAASKGFISTYKTPLIIGGVILAAIGGLYLVVR